MMATWLEGAGSVFDGVIGSRNVAVLEMRRLQNHPASIFMQEDATFLLGMTCTTIGGSCIS